MSKNMPARMLRLLSLLQARRAWSGDDLADRLDVTVRTVRRDIDRLRELGYPVAGTSGTAGGYQLRSGQDLPPLLLDDDEAVAVAVGLRTAAGGTVAGLAETSLQALAKLDQVLPARLRRQISAVVDATYAVAPRTGPEVDANVLAMLADARRDRELVMFDYRGRDALTPIQQASSRRVEPHTLVASHGLWYLIAYDADRSDWRTFRVDRIDGVEPTGRNFQPRELPAEDAAAYVARSITEAPYRYAAEVVVQAPVAVVTAQLPEVLPARISAVDGRTSEVKLAADSVDLVVRSLAAIAALDVDFEVSAPPELRVLVERAADRLRSSVSLPAL